MRSCIHPGYVGPLSSPLERGHDGFQPMVRVEWVVDEKFVIMGSRKYCRVQRYDNFTAGNDDGQSGKLKPCR